MRKPLTVRELKTLKIGEWVWIKNIKYGWADYYKRIKNAVGFSEHLFADFESVDDVQTLYFEDYGTKWIAFKNKEQAETKGN